MIIACVIFALMGIGRLTAAGAVGDLITSFANGGSAAVSSAALSVSTFVVPMAIMCFLEFWLGLRTWARSDFKVLLSAMRRMIIGLGIASALLVALVASPVLNGARALWVFIGLPVTIYATGICAALGTPALHDGRSKFFYVSRIVGIDLSFFGLLVAWEYSGAGQHVVWWFR
jgi:hypothetical protein